MSDIWLILLSNVGSLAVGFVVGQAIRWKRTPRGLVVPVGATSQRSMQLLAGVVTFIAFVSLLQGTITAQRQANTADAQAAATQSQTDCNNAFRATLKIRSDAANAQTQALVDLTQKLIMLPDNDSVGKRLARQDFIKAVERYVSTRQNNPYPDPTC